MSYLIILNDAPYGSERTFNGLRLAVNLLRQDPDLDLDVAMIGDAVSCGKAGQQVPPGYYSVERILRPILRRGRVLL